MKYLILLILISCAQTKFKDVNSIKNKDHGKFPTNYKAMIHKQWDNTLKDPDSLKVKSMSKPAKSHILNGEEKPHWYDDYSDVEFIPEFGYSVCTIYRGKNSHGAYTGWKQQVFFFKNGEMHTPIQVEKKFISGMHRKRSINGVKYTFDSCKS
jgi:hypothetical protein